MQKGIITCEWFNTIQGMIGIVAVRRIDGWRAFIGSCAGKDSEADQQLIADLGCPVKKRIAEAVFPQIRERYID